MATTPNPVGKPFAGTRMVKFLDRRILELKPHKSQGEIATEAGFLQVNMLAMIKTGASRLPLDRVPALARALDTDPAVLFSLAVEQQDAVLSHVLDEIYGTHVTKNEAAWLREIRDASGNSDPTLTSKARKAIRSVFGL